MENKKICKDCGIQFVETRVQGSSNFCTDCSKELQKVTVTQDYSQYENYLNGKKLEVKKAQEKAAAEKAAKTFEFNK